MIRLHCWSLGLACLLALGLSYAGEKPATSDCGNHGTSIEFVATPAEAAKLARKKEKLVFVLHVSGHFEDPRFT